MEIIPFEPKYLSQMALLYEKVYSTPGQQYNLPRAQKYLQSIYKDYQQYCLVAIENGQCVGGIFCQVLRHYYGNLLSISTVQVEPEFQRKGIGEKLVKKMVEEAKKEKLDGVWFWVERNNKPLINWYEELGFPVSSDQSLCYQFWNE